MVEHAIAFPVYLMMLLVTFDILRLCYCRLSLQFALTSLARQATVDLDHDPIDGMRTQLKNFGISWNGSSDTLTICPRDIMYTSCAPGTIVRGRPLEPMVFQADMRVSVLLPGESALVQLARTTLSTTVLGRNEPE
jgi:Flp pilus assembly protein TadG